MRRTPLTVAVVALIGTAVFADSPMPTSPPPAPAASTPATQPSSPKDVLNDMLKPGTERRRALKPVEGAPVKDETTINPIAPGNRPATLKREGGYVVNRTGRVTKSADGKSMEFNFEADANAMQDPPMVLLPNLALMVMQDQIKMSGIDRKFRVTGMVTEYMGRNYLLLQKVVTENE